MPGVVAFFSEKDIPGENTFLARSVLFPEKEEVRLLNTSILLM